MIQENPSPVKTVILNAKSVNYIDSTAVYTLRQILDDLHEKEITFLVAGAIGPTRDILFNSGLIKTIGDERIFSSTLDAYEYAVNQKGPSPLQKKISLQKKG